MSKLKFNYMLNAVMGLAYLLSGATGVAFLLMGDGGYQGGRNSGYATALLGLSRGTWSDLHAWTSVLMVVGVTVHIAFHWKWIVCATKKLLSRRTSQMPDARASV